jgi:hypothetical protein
MTKRDRWENSSKDYFCLGYLTILAMAFIGVFMLMARDSVAADLGNIIKDPTLEEQRLLDLLYKIEIPPSKRAKPEDYEGEFLKYFDHYVRDGCKEALSGTWKLNYEDNDGSKKDLVNISYNGKDDVFEGRLKFKDYINLEKNSLFFKVFFKNVACRSIFYGNEDSKGYIETCKSHLRKLTKNEVWIRTAKECHQMKFEGDEFYYDRTKKRQISSKVVLTMDGADKFHYQVEKNNWLFIRVDIK